MIFPENQVRNFYVATSVKTGSTAIGTTPGGVKAHQKGDKYWLEYVDANGKTITSDIIRTKNIRDIRISKPEGYNARTWTATMTVPNTVQNGDTFMLYLELGNVFGFGDGERFFYSYPIVKTSSITSAATLATAFANMLSDILKYNKVMSSVFESITASGANLVFTEKKPDFNGILGYYPTKAKVSITEAAVHADSTTESYISSITEANNATNSRNNGYKIASMERFFSKVRSDLYGYNGYPDVNPSGMITTNGDDNTYFVLDIKYYTQLSGVNNQNSEKEMSVAGTTSEDLFKLLYVAGTGEGAAPLVNLVTETSAGTAPDDNKSVVYTVNN